jgi:hypothetical protein
MIHLYAALAFHQMGSVSGRARAGARYSVCRSNERHPPGVMRPKSHCQRTRSECDTRTGHADSRSGTALGTREASGAASRNHYLGIPASMSSKYWTPGMDEC